jgi:hypothetical protein
LDPANAEPASTEAEAGDSGARGDSPIQIQDVLRAENPTADPRNCLDLQLQMTRAALNSIFLLAFKAPKLSDRGSEELPSES